jgi:hypothetical protein
MVRESVPGYDRVLYRMPVQISLVSDCLSIGQRVAGLAKPLPFVVPG